MLVEFANKQEIVNEKSDPREDLSLVYESEKVPFQLYAFKATRNGDKAILISFVYYLSDAPFQTPAPNPTRSPIPNSATDYIDKTFTNTIPNGQILIQSGSQVKQISGCHFINIHIADKNYFIRPETEVQIFDNVFEYTDLVNTYSMPIYANYDGSLTIRNCRFKARCSKVTGGDGNVYSVDKKLRTTFDSCQFINCGNDQSQYIIRVKSAEASLQLIGCTFTFDDATKSCKVFYLDSSDTIVDRCTFVKCGPQTLNINLNTDNNNEGIFQLTNNIVENNNNKFIEINNLMSKPVISGNIFRDITLSGYFIAITHNIDEISLYNNTFSRFTTSGTSVTFGGSIGSWYQRSSQTEETTIIYEKCNFYNLTNGFTDSPFNQGGAIQYGHSSSISNAILIFQHCEFIGNKCQNGKGGALAISINKNLEVSDCIFDECENANNRCFNIVKQAATQFTFENNIIQNMIARGSSGYFGVIMFNNAAETFTIYNLTIVNNSCNNAYGGGSGLWIQNVGKIIFNECNFINNVALRGTEPRKQRPSNKDYYTGDGGGIQYGFSASIYNIELQFTGCTFRENKAARHGGGIAVQMNKNVVIENCIFENNVANYQASNSKLLYENYYDLKNEGRGGAIYINPAFTYTEDNVAHNGLTPSVRIEGCTFRSNRAYDGYAIYIEGEDAGITFVIDGNTFIDNYDPESYSIANSVIASEIPNLYEGKVIASNTFSFTDPNVYVPEFLYVYHDGKRPTPSSTPIKTGSNVSESTSINNNFNIGFDCALDRGSTKIYLTCNTCAIKSNLYFTLSFENQEITKITYDSRKIFPETNPTRTLDSFVLAEKIILNKDNHSISFDTGSPDIRYDRIDNSIKCYVPLSEIVFEDGDCSAAKRCEKLVDEPRPVHVFVEISQFNDFNKSTEDGGAIHLINCCLTCPNTPFTNCASQEGGGGAIYIKNQLDYTNNITLIGLSFNECHAKYAGAVYIYSESARVPVLVKNCIFTKNYVIEDTNAEITGGSAIFLNTRNANVEGCQYSQNHGAASFCKVLTSFKSKKSTTGLASKNKLDFDSIIINECKFRADSDSRSLIKFIIGDAASNVEVKNCVFTGALKDGAHFIDEQILDRNSPLLKIKACKFSYGIKKSLNLDPKHDPSLIDFNDQVFNYSEFNESKKQSSLKLIVAIAVPAVAVVAILAVVAVVVIRKKRNVYSNEQDDNEMTSNLIDTSLI